MASVPGPAEPGRPGSPGRRQHGRRAARASGNSSDLRETILAATSLLLAERSFGELAEAGGHVGYHVVAPWQRQGHATRMLAAGLAECRRLGLGRVLLTCDPDNEPSRKVILANGGVPDGRKRDEDRFWIALGTPVPAAC
ncbi:MAG TPA: GNAT family N-acetyltransferase [Trebonia sp.]|nr:GNAT family N-acetyltransferase [Trebonia sp.]